MYFKKLELSGFKSFAHKTELIFEPGVTAIVGPNGCGKSNITDGIKWALGEQSAKSLRGSSMEDVIFNGTDKKEAVNFAEVNLTLSNESRILPIDYDEVTITRRLFRSGESEYLINKVQVRLKDIAELLMGTGIGLDAYSMIEQGKIDQILSSKPEDRRAVFEEASGITKYKAKKKEALRKLEQTEENLVRVNDIISEVKRQIGSLERQAQKANRYKELFETLKELDVKVLRFEYDRLKKSKEKALEELEKLRLKEGELNKDIEEKTNQINKLRDSLSIFDENISQARFNESQLQTKTAQSKNKISMDKERIEELNNRKVTIASEIENLNKKILSLEAEIKEKQSELENIAKEHLARQDSLSQIELELKKAVDAIEGAGAFLKGAKLNTIDIASRESQLKNTIAKVITNLQNKTNRSRRLSIEKDTIEKESSALKESLSNIMLNLESTKSEFDSKTSQKEKLDSDLNLNNTNLDSLTNGLKELETRFDRLRSKIEFLEDLQVKFEGYSGGTKALLSLINKEEFKLDGFCGTVANLLEVKEGLEGLVELALGEYAQALVVEDDLAVNGSIQFLKEHNLGRAHFFSLNSLPDNIEEIDLGEDSGLKSLLASVEVLPKYRNLFKYLLGNVFIVKDMESARSYLSRNAKVKLMTEDGQFISKGYFTGGSSIGDSDTGLIGRTARINHLKDELSKIQIEKDNISSQIEISQKKSDELNIAIKDLDAQIQRLQIELANRGNLKDNTQQQMKKINDEFDLVNLELSELDTELKALREEEGSLKKQIEAIEQESNKLQSAIGENQDIIAKNNELKEQLLVQLTEYKTKLDSVLDVETNKKNTLKMLEDSLQEQKSSSESRIKEAQTIDSKVKELTLEISQLQDDLLTLETQANSSEEDIDRLLDQRQSFVNQENALEDNFRNLQSKLNLIREELHKFDLDNNQLSYNQLSIKERVEQAYKINIEEVTVVFEEGFNPDNLLPQIQEMKAKIESMGPVNLVAIEEHKELQDRFTFLTNQREDLIKAKDSLYEVIDKINNTTKELFLGTFNKIQEEFKTFFRALFGGGDAQILLIDQEDILESGIEIVARPPGKRLQNISLLSGGEKAMTAIALLFAIFKVKPSPFCILDEIDAPLDEANIDRFSRVLQDFLKNSQFIIVTHNKKTISLADVMYGITMEESGISKVVSVKFADTKSSLDTKKRVEQPQAEVAQAA